MTPTHFAVCMFDAAAPITCTYAASAWKPAVGGVPSVPSGSVIYGTAGQYEYTFQLPSAVSSSLLDKQIRWSVGACVVAASPTPPTCTFATPVDLWLSTKNIIGDSISTSSSVGRNLYFEGLVRNPGTTPIAGPVYTTINIYNTLMTDGELCLQDPNDTMVKLTDQVVTYAGRLITVSTLPLDGQGKRVAPVDGVSGIYRPTAWRLPSVSSFLAVSGTIPALHVRPDGMTVPGLATVFAFTIQAPASQPVPAAYTAVMTPDYFNDVREWNETDNPKAQCHVIH